MHMKVRIVRRTFQMGTETGEGQQPTQRQRVADIAWKVAAALLVVFLIYVMLHFGSQLIELQGG